MTRSLIALVLFIAFFASCKQKEGDIITDIKKKSSEINKNLKDYKIKRADDLTASTEGGAIAGYYRDEEIKKINSEHFGEIGRIFDEYYFDDGMLIMIAEQKFNYNRPLNYTEKEAKESNDSEWYDDKKTRMETQNFYFSNNKLIKWEAGSKNISVSPQNFTDKESELWAETLILIKQLKEQD